MTAPVQYSDIEGLMNHKEEMSIFGLLELVLPKIMFHSFQCVTFISTENIILSIVNLSSYRVACCNKSCKLDWAKGPELSIS